MSNDLRKWWESYYNRLKLISRNWKASTEDSLKVNCIGHNWLKLIIHYLITDIEFSKIIKNYLHERFLWIALLTYFTITVIEFSSLNQVMMPLTVPVDSRCVRKTSPIKQNKKIILRKVLIIERLAQQPTLK